jgi:hypothetical protein
MPRIAPSQQIREEIMRVLQGGVPEGQDVTSVLLRLGAQRLAQELLEEDVTDFLGQELGANYYDERKKNAVVRGAIKRLERLGLPSRGRTRRLTVATGRHYVFGRRFSGEGA